MVLTKNFNLEEMLASDYATRHDIHEQFSPTEEIIENIKIGCEKILQPLRDYVGLIIISSAYRCLRTNTAIGGSGKSQHVNGEAFDIKSPHGNAYLFYKIIELGLPFHQLIWEFGTSEEPAWVHVSWSKNPKKEVLVAKIINGKTVYEKYQS